MIIPATYGVALALIVLSMLCWGSWANAFKLAGKWRFELFYYDYSLGVLIAALACAYTFGSLGSELSFADNLLIAGKRNMAFGFAAGAVFNLANMLMVAAISIAGLAVAFPVGIGVALVVGVIWNYVLNPQGNPILLACGVALVAGAIVFDALAYGKHPRNASATAAAAAAGVSAKRAALAKARPAPGKPAGGAKGLALSLAGGLLMGAFYPLVELGKGGGMEAAGLGPYAIAFLFALGVFTTTFVYNLYFLNLPVEGQPIPMTAYFTGTARQHALGIAGGVVWCAGAIANFVAASTPKELQVGPAVSYAIGQGATIVSALWGLLVWKEFAGASPEVKRLLAIMLALFVGGLALLSIAPLYSNPS